MEPALRPEPDVSSIDTLLVTDKYSQTQIQLTQLLLPIYICLL
jgi:hypothetical protein